jgi:hypothetical protein
MQTFISDIIPKIQRFSQKLDDLTMLTNQHWVVIDTIDKTKNVYIFRKNNELLVSSDGEVEKGRWEYLGNNSLLIVTNHRGNSESVGIVPLGLQSLNEVIYKFAVVDPEFVDCRPMDTIKFSFSQNRLMDFSYRDNCNSKVTFEKSETIKGMPVFGAATNYGNDFNSIDYSQLLFADEFSSDLFGSQDYYINTFLSTERGNFFSTLDKLPAWAKISEKDYNFELYFDLEKARKGARQVLLKDILSSEKPYGPYQDPIYQVSLPVKSFDINCEIKINNAGTKHLISKYVVSSDENYELTSEYWYDGDTVTIKTSGDLKNGILKKFEFRINPNTKPRNGEMRWLNIEYKGAGLYVIEASGRLGWDNVKNAQITSYQIFAKSTNQPSSDPQPLQLKSHGISTFTFEDGTTKQFKYKDGELIID